MPVYLNITPNDLFGKILLTEEENVDAVNIKTLDFHLITKYLMCMQRNFKDINNVKILIDLSMFVALISNYIDCVFNQYMCMKFTNIFTLMDMILKDIPTKDLQNNINMTGIDIIIKNSRNIENFLNTFCEGRVTNHMGLAREAHANFHKTLLFCRLLGFKLKLNSSIEDYVAYNKMLFIICRSPHFVNFEFSDDEKTVTTTALIRRIPLKTTDELSQSTPIAEDTSNRFSTLDCVIHDITLTSPIQNELLLKFYVTLDLFIGKYEEIRNQQNDVLSPKEVSCILFVSLEFLKSLKEIGNCGLYCTDIEKYLIQIPKILRTVNLLELLQSPDFKNIIALYVESMNYYLGATNDIANQITFFLWVCYQEVDQRCFLYEQENTTIYSFDNRYIESNSVMYIEVKEQTEYIKRNNLLPLTDRISDDFYQMLMDQAYLPVDGRSNEDMSSDESIDPQNESLVEYDLLTYEEDETLFNQLNQRGDERYAEITHYEEIYDEFRSRWRDVLANLGNEVHVWESLSEESCTVCNEIYHSTENPCVIGICNHIICYCCWKKMYDKSTTNNTKLFCPLCRGHMGEVIKSSSVFRIKNSFQM